MRSGDISAAINWLPKNFSIIADSGDNPTAGGVGDRADVLEAVLSKKIENVLFAGIASESAYNELQKGKLAGWVIRSLKLDESVVDW